MCTHDHILTKKYELKSAFNTAFLDFAKKALTQEPNSETKLAIRTLVQAIETNKLTYHNIREKALSFHIKNWLNPLKPMASTIGMPTADHSE